MGCGGCRFTPALALQVQANLKDSIQEIGGVGVPSWRFGMRSMLYTQVHCLRGNQVLMMRRNKEPNLGLWVAPGGKIETDESPYECAVRELREETGLTAHELQLRGIVSIVMPELEQHCMQFLYAVTDFSGQLVTDEREGELRWWTEEAALQLPVPADVSVSLPKVLDMSETFYQAKCVFDAEWQLLEVVEHTPRVP
jgi:8-oxo-dGTP diphosphatase